MTASCIPTGIKHQSGNTGLHLKEQFKGEKGNIQCHYAIIEVRWRISCAQLNAEDITTE